MAYEKLIAKLRNRATAYSPQSQMETMLEAADALEKFDNLIACMATTVSRMTEADMMEIAKGKTIHPGGMESQTQANIDSDSLDKPQTKPNPGEVVHALGICTEPFGCGGCAFGPPDEQFSCRYDLMLAADELLRQKYPE